MSANDIIEAVSLYREIPVQKIKGKSRESEIVNARHGAIYLVKKHLPFMTWKEIGIMFGGRDHSTAMAAKDAVLDSLSINDGLFRWVQQIDLGNTADLMLERMTQCLTAVDRGFYVQASTLLRDCIEMRQAYLTTMQAMKVDQILHEQSNDLHNAILNKNFKQIKSTI